jgi:hypothetical protein
MSQDPSNNQLILWYSNFSPYPNVSYAGYTSFQSIGVPSMVEFNYNGVPTIETPANVHSNFDVSNGYVELQCYVEYIYSTITTGPPYISNYQIPSNGYSSNGSSTRYNSNISDSGTSTPLIIGTSTNANVNTPFTVNNMYPDSTYNFSVQAKNSSNPNYGLTGPYSYSTQPPSYPTSTFFVPTPLFNSSGKKYTNSNAISYNLVLNNSTINNDIINYNNIGSSGFISNNIITAVQANGIYGKNSTSSTLNATASLNSTSTSITIKSFSFGPTFTDNSGGITVTSTTFDAYYKGNPYNQGFYLDCSTNMKISNTYPFGIPTSTLFNATLTENGNGINPNSSYSFYIDNLNSIPIYNSISGFTINPSNNNNYYSNQISGIWVLNQSQIPVFSINSLLLNNMGDYFYANPLVTYTFGGGVSGSPQETNSNITNTTNGKFANPINITNNSLQASSVSSTYNTLISLNITFNNLYGQGSASLPTINVICDQPSYNLITNLLSSSILNLGPSTSGYKGYRVWSANVDSGIPGGGTMNPSGLAPYPYIVNGFSIPNGTATGSTPSNLNQGYVDVSYNNIWDISNNTLTNQEILIANGIFTTNSNNYYSNYGSISSANGNTFDYTGLANTGNNGLKFSTFAWNLNNTTLSNINFTLNLTSLIYYQSTSNTWFFDNNTFTKPLYLFFRLEYTNNVTTWGNNNQGNPYPNTAWISVNTSTSFTDTNPTNICNIANIKNIYYAAATTQSTSPASGLVTFTAGRPAVDVNDYLATLYLRIGIPNGYDGFSNITCYLS